MVGVGPTLSASIKGRLSRPRRQSCGNYSKVRSGDVNAYLVSGHVILFHEFW